VVTVPIGSQVKRCPRSNAVCVHANNDSGPSTHGDATALITLDGRWTFAELLTDAASYAGGLATLTGLLGTGGFDAKAALFWAFVGIPLAWGIWKTLQSAANILCSSATCPRAR